MQRLLRSLLYIVVVSMLIACGWLVYRHAESDNLLSVQTGSMVPAFNPGDALWTRSTALQDLIVGDIVAYKNPANPTVIVSHRLIGVNYQTGKLITMGDALDLQDVPFPYMLVVGKVQKVVPHVGLALDWLHEPLGLAMIVYLPACIILLTESRRLFMKIRVPYYQLHSYALGYR